MTEISAGHEALAIFPVEDHWNMNTFLLKLFVQQSVNMPIIWRGRVQESDQIRMLFSYITLAEGQQSENSSNGVIGCDLELFHTPFSGYEYKVV